MEFEQQSKSSVRKKKQNNITQYPDSGIYLCDIKYQKLAMWSPWMCVHTANVALNRANLCVCVGCCLQSGDTLRSYPETSHGPSLLQEGWGYHPCWGDCWGCFYCRGTGFVSEMWGIWPVLSSLAEQTGWAAVFPPPTAAERGVWEKTDVNRCPPPHFLTASLSGGAQDSQTAQFSSVLC